MKKTVKLERYKLDAIKGILENYEDTFDGRASVSLATAMLKNVKAIQAEIALIDELPSTKISEGYEAYEKSRMELLRDHAVIGEDGNPVVRNLGNHSEVVIADDKREAFDAAIVELREANRDVLNAHEETLKARKEFMDSVTELDLVMIDPDKLPDIKSEGKGNGFALYVVEVLEPIFIQE